MRDGRIYFPDETTTTAVAGGETGGMAGLGPDRDAGAGVGMLVAPGQVIENAIGYARELETIV